MGLDMYLVARKYVGGWSHTKPEDRKVFDELVRLSGIVPDSDSPTFHIEADVGYWRKANAVHGWFVKNVQGGVDNCQEFYVSDEQLAALRDDCRKVLDSVETVTGRVADGMTWHLDGRIERHSREGEVVAQAGIAASIMPTQGGFFFGKTDYDEYYLKKLRDTIDIIDRINANPALKDCELYYRASW